jgi:RNA polymerase sigma-70 factor (ECF subfamily)
MWLKTMAIRMTLNYVTSEKRRGRFGSGSLEKMMLSRPWEEEDLELAQERRDFSRMGDLLDRLEPLERTALKMFYFDGMTYRQMSSLLGIPVQTLGSMLSRARVKLRTLGRNAEEK